MPGINRKGKLEKGAPQTNRDLTPVEFAMTDDQISVFKKKLKDRGRKKKPTKLSPTKIFKITSTSDLIPFGKQKGKKFNAVALTSPNYMQGLITHPQLEIKGEVFSRLALLILTSPKYTGKK
jgi:hypothetical protein